MPNDSQARRLPVARDSPLDPPPEYARLRESDPVSRLLFPDGRVGWLVSSYREVKQALSDARLSSRPDRAANPFRVIDQIVSNRPVRPGTFSAMDPPEHSKFRQLLGAQFTNIKLREMIPLIEEIISDCLSQMSEAQGEVDLVKFYARPVPVAVNCALLGVSVAHRDFFYTQANEIFKLSNSSERKIAAADRLNRYMRDIVQFRRSNPSADILGRLAEGTGSSWLSDEEIAGAASLILTAGIEPTANVIALSARVLSDPEFGWALAESGGTVSDAMVDELIRYFSVVQFGAIRVATSDISLGGHTIKAGETVVCSMASANRDINLFEDPDKLDWSRSKNPHLAFGHGAHRCLGRQLARMEIKIALTRLFERFPNLTMSVDVAELIYRDEMVDYGLEALPVRV